MTVAEPASPTSPAPTSPARPDHSADGSPPAGGSTVGRVGLGSRLGASLSASVLMTALVALAGILTSRLLGPGGRGQVSSAAVVAVAASSLATVGVELWAMAHIARRGWSGAAAGALRRQALAVVAVGAGAAGLADGFLGGTDRTLVVATTALAVATALMSLTLAIPLGMGLRGTQAAGYVAFGGTTLVLSGALYAADRRSVALAIGALAAGRSAGALANLGFSSRSRKTGRSPAGPARPTAEAGEPADWGAIYRFGLPASIGTTLTQSIYRLDFLLLAALGSVRLVGLYAAASTATEILWLVPDAFGPILLPHVAATRSFDDTARLVRISGLILLVGGGLVAASAPILIPLVFGDAFRAAVPALVPLVVAGVFLGTWKLLVADLAGRGDGRTRAVSVGTGVAVMIGTDLVLIPAFGIVGAGLGSALGYSAAAFVAARVWQRQGGRAADLVRLQRRDVTLLFDAARRLRGAAVVG
jgi:O-antigen/teichoic acid export membrane protein